MKCSNCGNGKFIIFNGYYECSFCGNIVKDNEYKEISKREKLENFYNIIKKEVYGESVNKELIYEISYEILKIDYMNIIGNFFIKYQNRFNNPDGYNDYIKQISEKELDDSLVDLLTTFLDKYQDDEMIELEEDTDIDEEFSETYDCFEENEEEIDQEDDELKEDCENNQKEDTVNDLIRKAIKLFEIEDYELALEITDRILELTDNIPNLIYFYISYCYTYGKGLEIDLQKAAEYWYLAGDSVRIGTDEELGKCFCLMGKEALKYEAKRKFSEHEVIPNYYLYENNSYRLLKYAAEYECADAASYLGLCYKYGVNVNENIETAFTLFKVAAERGSSEGLYQLAKCYESGLVVDKDEQKAFELYEKSADLGNSHAMVNLGVIYYYGKGVPLNPEKAVEYYKMASERDNVIGIYNLAKCYLKGKGVAVDYNRAYKLLKIAESRSFTPATEALYENYELFKSLNIK